MARLVLINGAPGSGKSTLARALAEEQSMSFALDVDAIKHSLGRWTDDVAAAGSHARRLALALAREHLSAGYDVVVGQYLARTEFIQDLEALAARVDAAFVEIVLDLDAAALAQRLAERSIAPSRSEHLVNNELVGPADAERLIASMETVRGSRPNAVWIDARGPLASTLERLRAALACS